MNTLSTITKEPTEGKVRNFRGKQQNKTKFVKEKKENNHPSLVVLKADDKTVNKLEGTRL